MYLIIQWSNHPIWSNMMSQYDPWFSYGFPRLFPWVFLVMIPWSHCDPSARSGSSKRNASAWSAWRPPRRNRRNSEGWEEPSLGKAWEKWWKMMGKWWRWLCIHGSWCCWLMFSSSYWLNHAQSIGKPLLRLQFGQCMSVTSARVLGLHWWIPGNGLTASRSSWVSVWPSFFIEMRKLM